MLQFLFSFFRSDNNSITDTCIKKTLDGIILFLLTMMPERSARKVVAVILLLVRWPVKTVGEYSGFKKSSIYDLRKKLRQLGPDANFLRFVRELCVVKKAADARVRSRISSRRSSRMPKYLVSVLYNSYLTMNTGIQQDLKSSGVI